MKNQEVCKVRTLAVGRTGKGYCLAMIKKVNKATARVVLIDKSYLPGNRRFTVQLCALWKVKARQRKAIERKVIKETTQVIWSSPLFGVVEDCTQYVLGLKSTTKIDLRSGTALYIAYDSVVDFTGDAIVNAANEGCLGGGGIDGVVNRLGGHDLQIARQELPVIEPLKSKRCNTGDAKVTTSGDLRCNKVIHAVGPCFGWCDDDHTENLLLLDKAYKSSILRAKEYDLHSIGFCILSGGVFRGSCPLHTVIKTGLNAIAKYAYPGLKTIVFCGFTHEEQKELDGIIGNLKLGNI